MIATYGAAHTAESPLWVGSIKSNIGHTQAAAGAAGLMKMILALNRELLPPTLHVDAPSPHIDWSAGTVRLLTEAVAWPQTDHPRTAAVSSFGISGTNAHLILQQAPVGATVPAPAVTEPVEESLVWVWPVSARSPKALAAQAERLCRHLVSHPDLDLADVAYSLATTRAQHPYRAAITGAITESVTSADLRGGLLGALQALSSGQPHPQVTQHHQLAHLAGKTVFVLPGQGAQYPGMGQELYERHRTFARTLDEVCAALDVHLDVALREVMFAETGSAAGELLHQTVYAQPALFAFGVAMHALFAEAGIHPDYLLGHSIGELAAAYLAGVFSLADAAVLVTARGRLMQSCVAGAMIAVAASEHDVAAVLADHPGAVIAAINGPASVVVSGPADQLARVGQDCAARDLKVTPLTVSHAFHSAAMDPALPEFQAIAAGLRFDPPSLPVLSNLTGDIATGDQLTCAEYWTRHLREPVRFYDSVACLLTESERVFVELSPHPVLAPAITDALGGLGGRAGSAVITTLHRERSELDAVAAALGRLHSYGHSPSWRGVYPRARAVALPTYPFEHRRYWLASSAVVDIGDQAERVLWKAVDDDALETVAKTLRISDAASLGPVVHALREWRKDLGDRSVVDKLRYRIGWQPITPNTFPPTCRRWLVLAFPEQVENNFWVTGLSALYTDEIEVLAVDPSDWDRNSLAQLLSSAAARTQCDVVVSFMPLHEQPHPGFPAISTGLMSTLLVAQAYGDSGLTVPLWVLTQGAFDLSPDDAAPSPSQSAVWGLGQSICLEHPDQWGGLIDLPHTATPDEVERLHKILSCPQIEDQLAIRQHGVSARRLQQAPSPLHRVRTWTTSGTALVTGATGRVGEHIIRWLVRAGATHLVLLSRNAAQSPKAKELEQELNAAGVTTTVASVDMTDRSGLADVIAQIRRQHGQIRTVVHAAATIGVHTISEVTADQFASDYAKAVAADYLADLLEHEPPDTVILFSSAAGVWGGARQGCYAAANAHIDALASRLRANGRTTALSVAWGLWADDGAMPHESVDYFHRIGVNQISPGTAITALQQSLDVDDTLITVADVSWNQFLEIFTARRSHPLLTELASAYPSGDRTTTTTPGSQALVARLASQSAEEQLATLTKLVTSTTATVLAHPDPGALDRDRPFKDFGIDSLTALELRNSLAAQTGLTLPATLVFDHPTPAAVAAQLVVLLSGAGAPVPMITAAGVRTEEPVAVIGMACRMPGGVDSAAGLWDLVASGTDAVGSFPTDRGWDLAGLFDPDPDAVGKTYTRHGGFVAQAAGFDAEFFGISAREAHAIDPQQRVLLEVCWEALETAGIDPAGLAGTDTGVFVGAWAQPFGAGGSESVEGYAMTGSATSVASGRVAYVLGVQGPAITVDTACSSSLVATHLACQSLRNGESGLALAGGVTVMTAPVAFTEFARQRGLAPDGRCKAFAAAADGVGWGEGAAVLVLERLSDARRNNHPVLAVIAGSAVNQDGASNGLTAPNGPAQQRVICQAAANAGIGLDQVDVVEAHGTGTTLGDPIEAGALLATYGTARDSEHPLWLGSIKSNIGHTQAAAGAAGIIKMVGALNHDMLPPTLHVDAPSPHIDWSAGTVRLLTEAVAWPQTDHPRTAAVSSFGISGTNAHLILQQAPIGATVPAPAVTEPVEESLVWVWPVSARSPKALAAQAERLCRHLVSHPDLDLADVAYSLATTRAQHPYRAAITGAITESVTSADLRGGLLGALQALSSGQPHPQVTQHHQLAHLAGKTVFVLPGQGAQYPGMGQELYERHRTFARTLDEVCAALDVHLDVALREVMFAETGSAAGELLHQTVYAQPALFAFGVAMHALFAEAGIHPDYLLGHSIGELAAAYLAGVFSLADAAVLVTARGRLMQSCVAGAMIAVAASEHDVAAVLADHPGAVIAAINGPASVVVSGPADQLARVGQDCAARDLKVTPLTVSHAFHSAAMDPALPEFQAIAAGLRFDPPSLPVLSNLTGDIATGDQLTCAEYWTRHLREPVRFYDSVACLLTESERVFVELSPHPVLAPAITDALGGLGGRAGSAVITTLHRERSELDAVAAALGRLHSYGHSPSWRGVYPRARAVALPTYPFEHRRYWLASSAVVDIGDQAERVLWKAVDDDALETVAKTLRISDAASLGPVVHALREWRKDLGDRSVVDKLRYRIGWQPITPNTFPPTCRRWLVLAFPEQVENNFWVTGLSALYTDEIEVLAVDPSDWDRNSLAQLLSSAAARTQCDVVVSFMPLHEQPHPGFPAISTGLMSTLLVAQAYGDSGLTVPLWVLTQGAFDLSPDDAAPSPSQSAVWGLGQSICLEHPDQWGGLIDLPHTATPDEVERLHKILSCPQIEDQLAIRQHGVSARRLQQAPSPLHRVRTWTTSGTALVTGATGRVGEHIIRWLVRAGATHLVLLSRNAAQSPKAKELEQELNAAGVTTTVASVDMTDRSGLADVIAQIRRQHGQIRTVVHAAATIGVHTISEVTADQFASDYAKAVAADYLADLLEHEPPDTVILFSSAAGVWGGARQGCYAAANAHIDALASRLRANGRTTALSVAWGPWADDGAMPHESVDYFHRIGVNQISPGTAITALQQSLDVDDTLITVADVSWNQFLEIFTARRSHPLLTELASAYPSGDRTTTTTPGSQALVARLASQSAEEQLATLTKLVTSTTATVLAHPDPGALDTERPFTDLGIDSLTGLELRNSLAAQTGLTLPATVIFDHPTPAAVAAQLVVLLSGAGAPVPMITAAGVRTEEPVAVIGMACRMPGGVDSAAGLWDLVASGTDAVGSFPADRGWDVAGLFDPDPDAVGKTYTRHGGFVAQAAGFDAEFFGISAREALAIDPQQRVLLEVCWEALETAGIDPAGLAGTDTGVFVGAWSQPYGAGGSESVEGYALTGSASSVASGRVAYVLGVQGPAITVDTACSSSLVATHLACQSLRNGESGLALAGGVTVMTTPVAFTEFARQRGLAPDGRCKAFAAAADGTGWGEGAAVLVLERLSDARRNNHPVLAVIAGSAVNQDGASNGLTAPNGPAQQRVICQAVANAGLSLDQVDVVEAHGTGTTLGDPIEAGALLATYGTARDSEHPLWLGSIKSNIGHTQAAAGAAGLMKMILALNHEMLPPTLHVDAPSPHIDWSAGTVQLLTQPMPWPQTDHPRTAAVSAFGMSGTNAHLILQQAPVGAEVSAPAVTEPVEESLVWVWPVSARSPKALAAQAERLCRHLVSHPDLDLADVAYSLATTRAQHPYRAAITGAVTSADLRQGLLGALQALSGGQPHPRVTQHHQLAHLAGKTVFVLPGQGAQYPGHGPRAL